MMTEPDRHGHGMRQARAPLGLARWTRGSVFLFLFLWHSAAARADEVQDFDSMSVPLNTWGTYTNAGWVLGDGQVWTDSLFWRPWSPTQACWLRDYVDKTNSWLRSPWLAEGTGEARWYALNRYTGVNCEFTLQYSTNGVSWETVARYTNTGINTVWTGYTNALEEWRPGYLRLHNGPNDYSGSNVKKMFLGLDSVTLTRPKGFKLSGLAHTPVAPTIDEAVHVRCTVKIHPNAGVTDVRAYYRFGTSGGFAWRPMRVLSGDLWGTETPVPAGRTGTVQYYVEATYTGLGGGAVRLPATGFASWTSTDPGGGTVDGRQNGPCSRASPLSISEIMYHPAARTDGLNAEYVEVLNTEPVAIELDGYRLSGEVDYMFPTGTVLAAGARVVVAGDPHAVELVYPTAGVLGPWTGNLPNGGGTVRLRNAQDAVLVEVEYDDATPWPAAADGGGASLVQMKPDYGERDVRAWAASQRVGGSPGYTLTDWTEGLSKVRINEWMTHTDPPLEDSVELYNGGNTTVDLSGCVLTDDVSVTNRYVIPGGTTIAADGYRVFTASQLGFDLSMSGDRLFLLNPARTRVVDAVAFGAQENGVSCGRTPDGAAEWTELGSHSFGAANTAPNLRDIVINEIMYHPLSGENRDQYVELYNRGAAPVDVGYWRFIDGIDYRMPAGTVIPAGGYLVVAKDKANLLAKYPQLNAGNTVGDFSGNLSDRGERLALAKPDDLALPGQDFVVVDEVTYSDGWGQWADGGGSSLELIDSHSDNRLGPNWAGSDETQKAPWTDIDYTDPVDNGIGPQPVELRIYGLAAGDYLVDNISVSVGASTNFNDTFESGPSTNWTFWGNHVRSGFWDQEGYTSTKSLYVRASARGENAGTAELFWNRVQVPLATALSPGQVATIRAKVRWLRGFPYLVLGTSGYWIETAARLTVPGNLGTPGQENSRAAANAGPAITEVQHDPVLPAASQAVRVTCRVQDADGVAVVNLRYRVDPSYTTNTVVMRDDGIAPDTLAGDGTYSGTIPGQAADVNAVFTIDARDGAAPAVTRSFPGAAPDGAPPLECVVRFGVPAPNCGSFGVYRIWISETNYSRWLAINGADRNGYSKEPIDTTFILDGRRAVYNAGARWRGNISDWTDPLTSGSYTVDLAKSDRILGSTGLKLDLAGQSGADSTRQLEPFCSWVGQSMGLPSPYLRRVRVYYNSSDRTVMQDCYMPSRDFCTSYFNDPDPQVYKNVGWGSDPFAVYTNAWGQEKQSRYRWHFSLRRPTVPNDDYSGIYQMVNAFALADPAIFRARVDALCDMENWTAFFATCGALGAWDHYGYNNEHNMFVYTPPHDRSRLFFHDMDHTLNAGGTGLFPYAGIVSAKLFVNTPVYRRRYLAFLARMLTGPFDTSRAYKQLDDWYAAYQANGMPAEAPADIKTSVAARIALIQAELVKYPASLEITTNGGADFSTAANPVTLAGTAPVEIETLRLNGVEYPVTWTSVTNWQAQVMLTPGANAMTWSGWLHGGAAATNAPDTITVTYTGASVLPDGWVTINEIQYHPTDPEGSYVEVYNRHPTATFDLGGMRLAGADVTFAAGTLLAPGQYGVVAENLPGYAAAYTNAEAVIAVYGGSLDNGGEWLRLWRPAGGTNEALVDEVYFDNEAPWPTAADGTGPSLQLIDASRDNNRVGNWAVDPVTRYTPGAANSVAAALPALPQVWINEAMPSNTSFVADNAGDYEPWLELYNAEGAGVDLGSGYRLSVNATNLAGWAFPSGRTVDAGAMQLVWMDGEPGETTPAALHAGLRLSSPTGLVVLVWNTGSRDLVLDYLAWDGTVPANRSWGRYPEGERYGGHLFHHPTPGTANDPSSESPTVALNEWMASNTRTVSDPANPVQPSWDDWFELHNYGEQAVNLTGFTLTDSLANPTKYRIPLGRTLAAGGYLRVWADEETGQNAVSNGDLHVNFKLAAGGEALGLYAPDGTAVDTLTFGPQLADISEGLWPNGTGTVWQLALPTPKSANRLFEVNGLEPGTGATVRIEWPTRPGWQYRLWSATDLVHGAWTPVGTGRWATGTSMSTNVPASGPPYYRVGQW